MVGLEAEQKAFQYGYVAVKTGVYLLLQLGISTMATQRQLLALCVSFNSESQLLGLLIICVCALVKTLPICLLASKKCSWWSLFCVS